MSRTEYSRMFETSSVSMNKRDLNNAEINGFKVRRMGEN